MLGGYKANIRQPPKRGQPLKRGQKLRSQSVLCSEVLLYIYMAGSLWQVHYGRFTMAGSLMFTMHVWWNFLVCYTYFDWCIGT